MENMKITEEVTDLDNTELKEITHTYKHFAWDNDVQGAGFETYTRYIIDILMKHYESMNKKGEYGIYKYIVDTQGITITGHIEYNS